MATPPPSHDLYTTPLNTRYCSAAMSQLFSARSRHSTWRQLWLWLAEAEHDLGVAAVSPDALARMRAHLSVSDDEFRAAAREEKRRRHDVMAHVAVFGQACGGEAEGVVHYGATSCYVTDNTELILMRDAMDLLLPKLAKVIGNLAQFAEKWKAEPALGFTHLQPAQLITVGKRAAQWAQDLMMDLDEIEKVRDGLKFRGAQGTTGTQASFLEIFNGDASKCDQLNALICRKAGFPSCYDVSTQTYTRKVDQIIANAVCGLGASAQKICGDIRHLAAWKEMEEPFEKDQIGSSAMAYKRNPMRCERIYSLARALMARPAAFAATFADQWFERTLDDSAIRRMDIPEMFLLADAILIGLDNVTSGLVVYPGRVQARVREELPFMVTENVIMKMVKAGASRQECHERIRVLSHEAGRRVKVDGKDNDLVERFKRDKFFEGVWGELDDMMRPELYIGRSVDIVERFCGKGGVVEKRIEKYRKGIEGVGTAELSV